MLPDLWQLFRPAIVPVLVVLAGLILATLVLAVLARRGYRPPLWTEIVSRPGRLLLFFGLTVLLVGALAILTPSIEAQRIERLQRSRFTSPLNLLFDTSFIHVPLSDTSTLNSALGESATFEKYDDKLIVYPQNKLTSALVTARSGERFRYSFHLDVEGDSSLGGTIQARVVWYNNAISITNHLDSPERKLFGDAYGDTFTPTSPQFHTTEVIAPPDAAFLRLEIRDVSPKYDSPADSKVAVFGITLVRQGVHVEPHPNAARASIAFSFDWESAMGGLIHSKGGYDPQAAERRGMEMRQGAEGLNELFGEKKVAATFYSTGYNLLDGNEERRTFAGDPTYQWARPKNGWADDYWTTHRWYSDDPYGNHTTHPGWYFGDLTRLFYGAGHEVASHTFGHLYVRGSNPEELGTDADEWLRVAKEAGIPEPTTFAFPWRSSNSLTSDFYDVLYERGIRAVTRIYERDMRDLYTLYAVPQYPEMYVMPDFLLGEREGDAMENEGGEVIGAEQGLKVLHEAIARRGTTSFWTHPEELAPGPHLDGNRAAWEQVVSATARLRDSGNLWIATVAEIVAYQADVSKVSASLDRGFLGWGGWKLIVRNDSGKELNGVTLTMPGEMRTARASGTEVRFVRVSGQEGEIVSDKIEVVDSQEQPARQLVFPALPAGTTEVNIEWASGQEPLE